MSMAIQSLLDETLITKINNAAAAATTAIDSSTILDMSGYDCVMFIVSLATATDTSVLTLTVMENTASSTSGATALTGTAPTFTASTSSNKLMIADAIRPSKRYVYANFTRTTANCAIDCIIAIQYRSKKLPVTQGTSVLASGKMGPGI